MKLKDDKFVNWQDQALYFVREKRDIATKTLNEWENLREEASHIKAHTLSHLDKYLLEFEKNATQNGFVVHWAEDKDEFNKIIYDILQKNKASKVVKSKSMLTEECELNPYLEKRGIEIVDTDLGERIVQLRHEKPSHIVLPAIHLKKEQVSQTFAKKLNSDPNNHDPKYLTRVAREHLRKKFLNSDATITGVNFAISESGAFVVCTNEGNADMGTSLTNLHIAVMGIEKIIPKVEDLAVFTRVLARSATGQAITTYTSYYQQPKKDSQVHIVIVDNGRSKILSSKSFQNSLKCIRCGACMNTCPIFRRAGGHNYSYTIPGPIGSLLGANRSLKKHGDLVFSSTLCGSCNNVCPVKIDITNQLLSYRKLYATSQHLPSSKRYIFKIASKILQSRFLTDISFRILKYLPKSIIYSKYNIWTKDREMPQVAKKSFQQLYKEMTNE